MVEPQPLNLMADPLTAVVDRFAPEKTSFFDPAAGQSIIARYANSRIAGSGAAGVAQSAEQLYRLKQNEEQQAFDRERMERERLTWTREDEDYEAMKQAEASRVDLLRTFNSIDATAPDYTQRLSEFMTSLPPSLVNDEALRVAIQAKNADADDARRATEAQKTREHQIAMANERLKAAGLKAGVPPELAEKYTSPDGTLDPMFFYEAGRMERENKKAEWDRRQKAMAEGRIRAVKPEDLSRKAREQRPMFKTMVEDTGAFPSQVGVFLKKSGKKSLQMAEASDPEGFRQAKAWDSKKFENELMTAYSYDNVEDYIKLGGDTLGEKQRELRRRFWNHAQESMEDTGEPAQQAPAVKRKTVNGVTYEFDGKGWKRAGG